MARADGIRPDAGLAGCIGVVAVEADVPAPVAGSGTGDAAARPAVPMESAAVMASALLAAAKEVRFRMF